MSSRTLHPFNRSANAHLRQQRIEACSDEANRTWKRICRNSYLLCELTLKALKIYGAKSCVSPTNKCAERESTRTTGKSETEICHRFSVSKPSSPFMHNERDAMTNNKKYDDDDLRLSNEKRGKSVFSIHWTISLHYSQPKSIARPVDEKRRMQTSTCTKSSTATFSFYAQPFHLMQSDEFGDAWNHEWLAAGCFAHWKRWKDLRFLLFLYSMQKNKNISKQIAANQFRTQNESERAICRQTKDFKWSLDWFGGMRTRAHVRKREKSNSKMMEIYVFHLPKFVPVSAQQTKNARKTLRRLNSNRSNYLVFECFRQRNQVDEQKDEKFSIFELRKNITFQRFSFATEIWQ